MHFQSKILIVFTLLCAQAAIAQSPDAALSNLSPVAREWVNHSCPRSLGPSLWSSCIVREASAATIGKPDLSGLNPVLGAWIVNSCPDTLGPSLTISCLNRENAALRADLPSFSSFTEQQKQWIESSCPTSLGPSLYVSCVQRESAALSGTQSVPQQPHAESSPAPRKSYSTPNRHSGRDTYEIEVTHNDELFIINGEKFEAKTYCLGWEDGDEILFLEGSPLGACASAELLNLRTHEKCDVWCE